MHHPEGEIQPGQRSLRIDEVHVEQVGTEFVQDRVEGDPVEEGAGEVGDRNGRVGSGHGFAAPSQQSSLQIGQGERLEHLVELVAQDQVPDESQRHLGVAVNDVRGRDVDERDALLVADGLQRGRDVAEHVNAEAALLSRHLLAGQSLDKLEKDPAVSEVVVKIGDRGSMPRPLELRVDPLGHRLLLNVFEADVDVDVVGVVRHRERFSTKQDSNFQRTNHFE